MENKGGGKKVGEHFVLSIFKTLGSTYKLWQQWDIQVPRWKNYSQGSFLILIMISDSSEWLKSRLLDTNLESVSVQKCSLPRVRPAPSEIKLMILGAGRTNSCLVNFETESKKVKLKTPTQLGDHRMEKEKQAKKNEEGLGDLDTNFNQE